MSNPGGFPYWLPFFLQVGAGLADEITVGPVWGPGVVEALSAEADGTVYVRAWAVPSRLPLREGLAQNLVDPQGDLLTRMATDSTGQQAREGLVLVAVTPRVVEIGRVVPWAPWYLLVRVENITLAVVNAAGQFVVRVSEREDLWAEMAAGQRAAELRERVGFVRGDSDGRVGGYRSWV